MLPLYCPTVVKVPVYWSLALKSCIFNCGRSQTSSFCHQRQFFFISLLPFVLSEFQLFFFIHQHHIFIVFLLFHLNIIDPTSTLDVPHTEPHFIHELKTRGYDFVGANGFLSKLMRFWRKTTGWFNPYHTLKDRHLREESWFLQSRYGVDI